MLKRSALAVLVVLGGCGGATSGDGACAETGAYDVTLTCCDGVRSSRLDLAAFPPVGCTSESLSCSGVGRVEHYECSGQPMTLSLQFSDAGISGTLDAEGCRCAVSGTPVTE